MPPSPPHRQSKLEERLFTNMDLQADVALLAAKLANGSSIDHFVVPQELIDRVNYDGKIQLLQCCIDGMI